MLGAAGAGLDEEFVQLSKVVERLSPPRGEEVTWKTLFTLEGELVDLSKRILTKGNDTLSRRCCPCECTVVFQWVCYNRPSENQCFHTLYMLFNSCR